MERLTTTGSAEFTPRRWTAVLQNGVDLAHCPEEVFDYLSDLRNEKEWNPKIQLAEAVTDGPPRAGSKFRAKWQGSPVTIVEYITYDRPKAWSATAPSKSLTIDFYATVTPTEKGSRLDVRMTLIPHGPLCLLLPLIRRRLQQQEVDNMRFIKRKLEERASGMRAIPPQHQS
jgi:uncharacterized protein YndB with AHSA1/START domain